MALDFSQYGSLEEESPDFSKSSSLDFSSKASPIEEEPSAKGNLGESFKRASGDFAQAIDMIAGIPGFFAKLGATGTADVIYSLAGSENPAAKASEFVDKLIKTHAGKYATAPVQTLLEDLGVKNIAKGTLTEEMFGKITEGIEKAANQTDDPNKQALIRQAADVLMAGVGVGGARFLKGKETTKESLTDALARMQKEVPKESPVFTTEPADLFPETLKTPYGTKTGEVPSGWTVDENGIPVNRTRTENLQRTEIAPIEREMAAGLSQEAPLGVWEKTKSQGTFIPKQDFTLEERPIVPEKQMGIPFEKVTPEQLRTQTGELFTPEMQTIEPRKFATPEQGIEHIQRIPTDVTPVKGEPFQPELPGTNEPLGQTGFGKGQRGSIGFKKEPPTLEEQAKTLPKEDWIAAFNKQHPGNEQFADKLYNQYAPKETLIKNAPRELNSTKQLFNEKIKDWDGQNKVDQRAVMQGENLLTSLEKDKAARENLYDVIESGTQKDHPFVKAFRGLSDTIYDRASKAGVVNSYIDNYITHMYDFGKQTNSQALDALYRLSDNLGRTTSSGMSTKSPYARERTFATIQEAANKMGLKPLTKDPAEVYQVYATSMLKAVNNKKLIEELQNIKNPDTGQGLIINMPKDGSFPKNYTTVNNRQFFGKLVDKSVAPTIDSMFSAYNPSDIARVMQTVSALAKTAIFSFSGFHIKSLADVLVGSARTKNIITDQAKLMDMWKNSKGGDVVEDLLRGGLEIGHASLDLNPGLVKGIVNDSAAMADKLVPGLGMVVKVPGKVAEGLTDFLWKVVHPSFKMSLASQEYARLLSKGIDKKQAAEMASTFANDAMGGLNWRRLALNASTDVGENLANALASKRGQAYAQIGLLAPDWTIATARSWLGAIRKGANPAERAMYAKYLLQSAVIYAGVADALNMYFTGHHFWQNDDPTYVDMGDGRKMQLSKHFMEGIHWITDPDKTLANKLGTIPAELISQLTNKQYVSSKGAPDIVPKEKQDFLHKQNLAEQKSKALGLRLEHLASRFSPITGQALMNQTPESALSGFLGVPILGKTTEEKQKADIEKLMEKYK